MTQELQLVEAVKSHQYVAVIQPSRMTELKAQASKFALITTKEAREQADEFLKMAKKELKQHSDNRLEYTRKIAALVKHVSEPEKELEDTLKPVEKAITAQLQREAEAQRQEQLRIREEARKKEEAERRENERIATLKAGVARLRTEPITRMQNASNLSEFSVVVGTLERMKDGSAYEEFAEEAKELIQAALAQAPVLKLELEARLKAARENAEEAQRQAQERQEARRKMEAEQAAERERIAAEQREADMKAAANADMERQAQEQAMEPVKGTRTVWKFEVTDLKQVPGKYFIVDEKAITQAIKDGERNIPGVKIYSEVTRSGR